MLKGLIDIIDKYSNVKTLIIWFIAWTLMFVIYRLYVPVFKKTGEILQFKLNYKFKIRIYNIVFTIKFMLILIANDNHNLIINKFLINKIIF